MRVSVLQPGRPHHAASTSPVCVAYLGARQGRRAIELVRMPFSRALDLASSGELCEAQTALAVILAGRAL